VSKLLYGAIASIDGYVADEDGNFDWAAPDAELHAFVNEVERPIGTYLYGRRMYETMAVWETMALDDQSPEVRDYADIWRAADKIVFSRTLEEPTSSRTRIERAFDPAAVRDLKAAASSDITIGGAELATQAFEARLVDELHLFVVPVLVGGGRRFLGEDVSARLELLDERRFRNGAVVPAEVVSLRAIDLTERGHALDREPVDLQRLLVRKPGELADVPVGGHHQMTARVGELVQQHERVLAAVDDQPLLVVSGGRVAENAAGLLVGLLDVLEPPGRPELLGHGNEPTVLPAKGLNSCS
jgi:dihydrofolate reductase